MDSTRHDIEAASEVFAIPHDVVASIPAEHPRAEVS